MFERIALGRDSYLDVAKSWLSPSESDELLARLIDELTWERRANLVYGRTTPHARLMAWAGELPYTFSGQTLEPRPLASVLQPVHEQVCTALDYDFNHLILNRYEGGHEFIGPHSDNESELGQDPFIAALSLGVTRDFILTSKRKRHIQEKVPLTHGSLIVMGGRCQYRWHHEIPKQPNIAGERVNLTFRKLFGKPGWRSWDPSTHHLGLDPKGFTPA
jgi:alkylated DNA repair dioxygenase AlkB